MPAVSVVIPTYNHRDFILATLDSVFAQTFADYEVIVINDGSPDDTADVLKPLADAGRIRYLEQANAGQSLARNRGIAEAQGEFVALLDDDDLWPPDKLQWQVEAMERHPDAGVIGGPTTLIDADGKRIARTDFVSEITFAACVAECPFVSPGQTLIRASLLRDVGGLNPDIWGADDWDLWLRLTKRTRILLEDRDALFYRKHAGNASNNLCRMVDNCFLVVNTYLADIEPKQRRQVTQAAYLWLYSTQGKPIVRKIKEAIKARQLRLLPPYLTRLMRFTKALTSSPLTAMRFVRDCLPLSWSSHLHRPV